MKKLLILSIFLLSIQQVSSQNVLDELKKVKDSILNLDIKEKKMTATVEVTGKSKSEIYSSINKWVSLNYNSANNVIQMNDKESGIMIVKGLSAVSYINPSRATYPKTKVFPIRNEMLLNHLLEIKVKENKYRLIYTISRIADGSPKNTMYANPNTFDCINLKGVTDESIVKFNYHWRKSFGKSISKKEAKYLSLSKPTFDEINSKMALSFVSNFISITKMVNETSDDDW
jgi:hypothetical protein